jgi:hypothetical protein
MTSQPFALRGSLITFAVGGGCDPQRVYAELLVDGDSVLRATGACRETMRTVYWPVGAYRGRTGVIRVVDASSASPWGHINVDDFRFSWSMGGGGGAAMAASGAVHVFSRVLPVGLPDAGSNYPTSSNLRIAPSSPPYSHQAGLRAPSVAMRRLWASACGDSARQPLSCVWQHDAALQPASVRPGLLFGSSVAVDDATGTLLASAAGGPELLPALLAAGAAAAASSAATAGSGGQAAQGAVQVTAPLAGFGVPAASMLSQVPAARQLRYQRARQSLAALLGGSSSGEWPDAAPSAFYEGGSVAGLSSGLLPLLWDASPHTLALLASSPQALASAGAGTLPPGSLAAALLWSSLWPASAGLSAVEGAPLDDLAAATAAPAQHDVSAWAGGPGRLSHSASVQGLPSLLRPRPSSLALGLRDPAAADDAATRLAWARVRQARLSQASAGAALAGADGAAGSASVDPEAAEAALRGRLEEQAAQRPAPPAPAAGFLYMFRAAPELHSGDRQSLVQPAEAGAFADPADGAPALSGQLVRARAWSTVEHATLDLPAISGSPQQRASLQHPLAGARVALSGFSALVGTPRDARAGPRSGGAVLLDAAVAWVGFGDGGTPKHGEAGPGAAGDPTSPADLRGAASAAAGGWAATQPYQAFPGNASTLFHDPYVVSEGVVGGRLVIPVYRHAGLTAGGGPSLANVPGLSAAVALGRRAITIAYATVDITAVGIDHTRAAACASLPALRRHAAGCGHYVRTSGSLTFYPEHDRADIVVPIIDDACHTGSPRLFGVQLSVPGGLALAGQTYSVTVRIDEDDLAASAADGHDPRASPWCTAP